MKLYGVISDQRALKSKSPVMHNAVLERHGLSGVYVPFVVENDRIGAAVLGLTALGVQGANVTVPYKESVIPFLNGLSDEARALGAVNTIVRKDNTLAGYNTDALGFMDALKRTGFRTDGCQALVFGNGGGAKAVSYALKNLGGAQVTMIGRNAGRVAKAAERFGLEWTTFESIQGQTLAADLIVNATSVSSTEESPETAALISELKVDGCGFVMDINYGRVENFWYALSQRLGSTFQDGLAMLAYQAVRSFRLWTEMDVDPSEFMEALEIGA